MNPLKTVMAAALAAFCVISAFPAGAAKKGPSTPAVAKKGPTAPVTAPTGAKDEGNPINVLAALIAKDKKAQADVSARIQRLILDPDFKKRSYLHENLPKYVTLEALAAMVNQWVEKNPADAAELYFVARPLPGKIPGWIPKNLSFKEDEGCAPLPERLANHLAGVDQMNPAGSMVGKVGAKGIDSVSAFILEAVKGAQTVRKPGVACSPGKAKEGAESNDKPLPVPGGAAGGVKLDGAASGFSFADLYEEGAVVANVAGPKDEGYRTLSIKMYSIPDGKGNFVNKIGIVDITDPKFPYGPEFVALGQGETTFDLREGGRKYTLNMDKDDNVVIKRPGSEGEGVAKTSVGELSKKRLDQVAGRGSIDIGGKSYYVLGQGGLKGSLVFFSKKEIDGRKPPYGTEAVASAEVSEVIEKVTRPIKSKPGPDLGEIDGKPYHLVFDGELKIWKVMPGPGYIPPKEPVAKEPGKSGKQTEGGASAAGDASEEKSLAEVVARLKTLGFKEPNPDGNAGFSDDMKKYVHILASPDGKQPYCFILAPGMLDGNQACYPSKSKLGGALVGLHGSGDYGVVDFEKSTTYFPLDAITLKEGATHAGIYGKAGMIEVKDVYVAIDVLKNYEKFPEAKWKLIAERLNKHAKGTYSISSNKTTGQVLIYNDSEDKTYTVWPKEFEGTDNDTAGLEERKGPGTAVDLAFGPDGEFQNPFPFDATQMMVLQKVSEPDKGTALYLIDDKESGEKKWYLMVRAKVAGATMRSAKVQLFGTGKDWFALPSAYSMKGYSSTVVPRTAKIGRVLAQEGKQGSLCLYRNTTNAKEAKDKKGNSVGPLFWWGVGEAEAAKACRAGKF